MKKNYLICLLITLLTYTPGLSAQEYTSGDADIDRVRREVKRQKTTKENFRERHLMLYMWLGALQQQGADTHSFFNLDTEYFQMERRVNNPQGVAYQQALERICQLVDEGFEHMEQIQKTLVEEGPIFTAFEGTTKVTGGDYSAQNNVPNYMIRSGDLKLMVPGHENNRSISALYNLKDDPHEMRNLIMSPVSPKKNSEQAQEMKERLLRWIQKHEPHRADDFNKAAFR